MLRTTKLFALLLAAALMGCGKDKPAATTTGNTTGASGTNPANTTGGGENPSGTNGTGGGTTTGGGAAKFVAPQGALAAHAAGLATVQADHFAVLKMDLAAARESKLAQSLPENAAEFVDEVAPGGDVTQLTGVMGDVHQIWASFGPPRPDGPAGAPVSVNVYVRGRSEAIGQYLNQRGLQGAPIQYNGQTYFHDRDAFIRHAGNKLFICSDEAGMKQLIDAGGKLADAPLLAKLKDVNFNAHFVVAGSLGPLREMASEMAKQAAEEAPVPHVKMAADLVEKLEWGTLTLDLSGAKLLDIQLDVSDDASADQLNTLLTGLVAMGKIGLKEAVDRGGVVEILNLAKGGLDAVKVDRNGKHVSASLAHFHELDHLPAIIAAAEGAAKKNDAMNNGRQIGLALLNFENSHAAFPTNIYDGSAKDVLSWRVAILPYLENVNLYEQFQLNEAWNSDHNRPASETELEIYQTDSADGPATTTWKFLKDMPGDIMLIDAGKGTAVPWAQPDKFTLEPLDPLAALGEEPPEGYLVVYKDTHTARLKKDALKAALAKDPADAPPTEEPPPETEPDPTDPPEVTETPEPEARVWKDASGKFSVEAVLGEVKGASVTIIRTDNGKAITLPINKLSKEDQDYLKGLKN